MTCIINYSQSKKSKDIESIKSMCGCFKIDFNFADIEKGLEESVVMAVVLDHEDFFLWIWANYWNLSKQHSNVFSNNILWF